MAKSVYIFGWIGWDSPCHEPILTLKNETQAKSSNPQNTHVCSAIENCFSMQLGKVKLSSDT